MNFKLILFVVFLVLNVVACKEQIAEGRLEGGRWDIVSVNAKPVRSSASFTIKGVTISGNDGCNTYGSSLDGSSPSGVTAMGCPEGFVEITPDIRYLQNHPEGYTIEGDLLSIAAHDSQPALVFKRVKDDSKK